MAAVRPRKPTNGAEAICEAVTLPTMRFVAVKIEDQLAVLMLHKARELLVRRRTMLNNAIRAHMAELGTVTPQGTDGLKALKAHFLSEQVEKLEAEILSRHKASDASRRLATIPGVGPITASAIAASVPDASLFRSARRFAAWLGPTPRAHSSGEKDRQTGIRKQGDGYIWRLLLTGATAVLRFARQSDAGKAWLVRLKERKKPKVVASRRRTKPLALLGRCCGGTRFTSLQTWAERWQMHRAEKR